MKRKGKRFLVLLTTASLSLNMLGISAFAAEGFSGDGRCFRFRDLKERD